MKKKIALGTAAAAAAVTALLSGSIANASSAADNATPTGASASPAPVSTGAYKIADDLLKADSTLRGPRLAHRYNLWVVGLHGRATVRDKGPTYIDYTWQKGAITAVGTTWLRVKSNDGLVRNWILAPGTRIRKDGHKTDVSKLVVGDRVFVLGVPGKPNQPATPTATPSPTTAPADPATGGELAPNTHPTAALVTVPRNKSVAN